MNYQGDDARLRVPKATAQRLAKVAKELNITGRAPWGTLARKVLLDFLESLANIDEDFK